jgi:hypothetical protein
VQLTPRRNWIAIILAAIVGVLFGFFVDLILVAIIGGLSHLYILFFPDPVVPLWFYRPLQITALSVASTPPLWLAIRMALKESREQAIAYRTATNRCLHCGYSLNGIRRIGQRCPECGERFKPL